LRASTRGVETLRFEDDEASCHVALAVEEWSAEANDGGFARIGKVRFPRRHPQIERILFVEGNKHEKHLFSPIPKSADATSGGDGHDRFERAVENGGRCLRNRKIDGMDFCTFDQRGRRVHAFGEGPPVGGQLAARAAKPNARPNA